MKALVRGVAWKEVAMISVKRATLVIRFMVRGEALPGGATADEIGASEILAEVLLDIGPARCSLGLVRIVVVGDGSAGIGIPRCTPCDSSAENGSDALPFTSVTMSFGSQSR